MDALLFENTQKYTDANEKITLNMGVFRWADTKREPLIAGPYAGMTWMPAPLEKFMEGVEYDALVELNNDWIYGKD